MASSNLTKSKKLTITLAALCIALIVALITVISVWAASTQTVASTLKVTYSASNVSATVTGAYRLQGDENFTSIGQVSFAATDKSTSKSISTADSIELTDTVKYVVFKYTFQNDSETAAFKVSLTKNISKTDNITVVYAVSSEKLEYDTTLTGEELEDFTVAGDSTMYAYIKVRLDNITNNADFEASVSWSMVRITETAD